jgi:hypothetical protein
VPETPQAEYARRLQALAATRLRLKQRDRLFIAAKLIVGIVLLIAAVWLTRDDPSRIAYLLIPISVLAALFILHERTLKALRQNTSLQQVYEQGIARLEDSWSGKGETGERYLQSATGSLIHPDPDAHPYARDLDLFGSGSLYQLLCTARTRVGQDTLAAWLLAPAPVPEIEARQQAIRELTPLLGFREHLAIAASEIQQKRSASKITTAENPLATWSVSPDQLDPRLRLPAIALAAIWLLAIAGWAARGWESAAILISILNRTLGYRYRDQIREASAAIEAAAQDLQLLAALFAVIEQQSFASPRLQALQASLNQSGQRPSQALKQLEQRCDWLFSSDNLFVRLLDLFVYWKAHCIFAIQSWRTRYGSSVRDWLAIIGEIEALNALAVYAYENPSDPFPTFVTESPCFDAEDFAHPLLPRSRAITNSLRLDQDLQLIVISGPNMAGKSTFIRSIGINVVLAHAGAPVRARSMQLSPLNVAASICILDSLQGGLSRFYAEITRLKHIDTLSRQPTPVLFLLDELLSGTNSHDRRIGTESIVRNLVARGAIGLVTTHDLALAEIAGNMGTHAANYHFEDRYENGQLYFEYKLSPGIVQTSNALQLMRSIGLEI